MTETESNGQNRFLLDYEVEAHGCLAPGVPELRSAPDPNGTEVWISNLSVELGTDRPLPSIQVVLNGENIDSVRDASRTALEAFLSLLTLATCVSFTPRRLLRIVDWTKGLKERDCIQLDGFMGADLPRPILSAGILKSVDSLLALKVDAKLLRAARWFAAGVRAEAVEEQFQFFYLCLEVMAQLTKSPDPVNDKCAKCGAALLCEKCGVHSTHKPYPKQAIEALFLKIVTTGGNDLFAHANAARNALMHGDSIDEALQSRGVDIVKVVDALGHISHKVLLQAFVGQLSALESSTRMNILMTNMFTHQILTARTHLIVSSADPGNPRLSEIARPTVTLQYPTMPPAPNQSK